jgi:hypothetical protein
MKAAVGYLSAAVLLGIVGVSLWGVGMLEQRAAAARERMFTLQYGTRAPANEPLDAAASYARRLPVIGRISADAARQRATSDYWLGEYDRLAALAEATSDAGAGVDPALLLMSAHAAYRRTKLDGSDPDVVKRLDGILNVYTDILKRDPGQEDAAYNFEFIARTRNALALVRRGPARAARDPRLNSMPRPGRTLHGDRGAIPAGVEATEFKVIVPQPSDERQDQREAGSGTPRARKG